MSKLYKAVNAFAAALRRVATEDKAYLTDSGLHFDLHALIGGQLTKDAVHKLYLVYPEGNWVEISHGTPYHIIGEGGYGKPVLDLPYEEDSVAEVDSNIVMTGSGKFVEIQASGEEATFDAAELARLISLAKIGIEKISKLQNEAIENGQKIESIG